MKTNRLSGLAALAVGVLLLFGWTATRANPTESAPPAAATGKKCSSAPTGYARDDNCRLFQVTFDLRRRFYMGSRWAPVFDLDGRDYERVGFDFGFRGHVFNDWKRKRYRFRAIEGQLSLEPMDFDILVFGYDLGVDREKPALWITTFFGKPRRHDLDIDLGWGMRLGKISYHPMRSDTYTDIENMALYVSWELWHNSSLANYFRVSIGPALGELVSGKEDEDARFSIYPVAALDGEFVLDKRGLHHIGLHAGGWARAYTDDMSTLHYMGKGSLWYEWVLIAVNDQPVSLYLEGAANYRDDLPDVPSDVEFRGMAGLRFSFWAPPLEPVSDRDGR